ncbi:MAG: 50S ribosomal protein L4 [Nitrosopumilus sp.]|nr:50S ribosomal protein L4 [Nitrosopumilus sp.]MDA7943664.1 50S ribosomal protein L4 [Nitrosopumilus sp.]MDA7952479.1 50S ribosomal protein L4 [Nitrosopumilus sp.]MDA7957617.1 50S ribosomal protein L4 [Nitrosopumilus sp.]MDA7999590.1 50S ribosomal protein L4 [Nitrosopumilus sp.]
MTQTYALDGTPEGEVDLPPVFATPLRRDLIRKAFVNLASHSYQRQGRKPSAGMDVVADSNDPPTGRGVSRVARAAGGGGGRQGQGAEVASTRGGRQAHPPKAEKVIYKKLNKKEGRLALCSAIAATASRRLAEARGHVVDGEREFPLVVSDGIESVSRASEALGVLGALGIAGDSARLESRRRRSGRPLLRGRAKKEGKSALFVVSDASKISRAVGAIPGVEAVSAGTLSVLDLAPGSDPARLAVYSVSAIRELGRLGRAPA